MSIQRVFILFITILPCFLNSSEGSAQEQVDYHREIVPIFRTYCVGCHSGDEPEGEFSLETYQLLLKGGEKGNPIQAGNAAASFLIRSVEGKARPKMPPRKEPQLPDSLKAKLRLWVQQGAHGPRNDASILKTLVTQKILPAAPHHQPITAVSLSSDKKYLAIGRYKTVELRDPQTYTLLHEIKNLPGKVQNLEFSKESQSLAVATGITGLSGQALILSIPDGKPVESFGGHRDLLYDATFSPDGIHFATAGYDRVIKIWNLKSKKLHQEISVHKGAIFDLEFSPDAKVLASASADETVKLWRVSDGTRLDTLNQPQGEQRQVAFTPDGNHILSVGRDKRIHLWEFLSKESPRLNPQLHSRFAHESDIVSLKISSDGQVALTTAQDRSLKAWSLPQLQEIVTFNPQSEIVSSIDTFLSSRSFVISRFDGTLETITLPKIQKKSSTGALLAEPTPLDLKTEFHSYNEKETTPSESKSLTVNLPAKIQGQIDHLKDDDTFKFKLKAGQQVALEVHAQRSKSQLDSKIEVLTPDGAPIKQVTLQATRDSWFTFRGKDSNTSDDFRVHNWREMELDEYLYANGEVVKLWLYPRGPDSGFKVYPGAGSRHTYFSTTALSHPLGEPCYIVSPLPPGSQPTPNGLPVFDVYYENDDGPYRRRGKDSFLIFTAPYDGEFLAKVSDVRGFGATKNYQYTLSIRAPQPDFSVSIGGKNPKVSPGSGRELTFNASRREGFTQAIDIKIENLPKGFSTIEKNVIEENQIQAKIVLFAAKDAKAPSPEEAQKIKITATATINGKKIARDLGNLGTIQLSPKAKVQAEIHPLSADSKIERNSKGQLVFKIRPGETIQAMVKVQRNGFGGRIDFGNFDSGRNLPYGLYVDNIGLNGLLIVEGQSERNFFITASPISKPGRREFFLRASPDGGQCSKACVIEVLPPEKSNKGKVLKLREF